jgi:hypothetical protein
MTTAIGALGILASFVHRDAKQRQAQKMWRDVEGL